MASTQALYRACTLTALVADNSSNVFFAINGAASKRIKVRKIRLSCPTLTAATLLDLLVQKCSAAQTGGTPGTAMTKTPMSSGLGAASATVTVYTAGATIGTLVGTVASRRVMGLTATPVATDSRPEVVIDLCGEGHLDGLSLDSAAETVVMKFGSAPGSATSMTIELEWSEHS